MASVDMVKIKELAERIASEHELEWNEGADQEDINSIEEDLDITLPAEYRAFLEWHDGTDDREFMSVEEILDTAEELLDEEELNLEDAEDPQAEAAALNRTGTSGLTKDGNFVRGWVPFYDYGTGDFDCLDCAPGPKGAHGQVIRYSASSKGIVAASFTEWLESFDSDEL
jgi:cell wall assembly regulator SMI1